MTNYDLPVKIRINFYFGFIKLIIIDVLYLFTPLGYTQLDMSDQRAIELLMAISHRLFGAIIENDATSVFPS